MGYYDFERKLRFYDREKQSAAEIWINPKKSSLTMSLFTLLTTRQRCLAVLRSTIRENLLPRR
jgi:hypothetical protein